MTLKARLPLAIPVIVIPVWDKSLYAFPLIINPDHYALKERC